MIVFATIVPHSPLLLPTIGSEYVEILRGTLAACETVRRELQDAKPDVVMIISPHNTALANAVVLNLADEYRGELVQFGDLRTKRIYRPDTPLIDQLQRTLREKNQPVTLLSASTLDYGATVPLVLLEISETLPLVPVFPADDLNFKKHFIFGEIAQEELGVSPKRIAIIASCNLSHRLSSDAPAGFSSQGEKFDATVRESLETKNITRLMKLNPNFVQEAGQCGFRGVMLLLGILSHSSATSRILSYEHPFGVGYLTASFTLS